MKRTGGLAALAAVMGIALTGCLWEGPDEVIASEELAAIASVASDFQSMQVVAAMGRLEIDDLEESGGGAPASVVGGGPSHSVTVDETIHVLPDGTVVTITRQTDDRDTTDPEDDLITVTRKYSIWGGQAQRLETVRRPRKPESDWTGWESDGRLTQTGSIETFVDGVRIKTGTVLATWKRVGSMVTLEQVVREDFRIDRTGTLTRIVIDIDGNGAATKTTYRVRLEGSGELVVQAFVHEEIQEDGQTYTRITRQDGHYLIIRSARDPRVIDYYTPEGTRTARQTETRVGRTLDVSWEFFDEEGHVTGTRHVVLTFHFLGDEVVITKEFDRGHSTVVRIQELEDGRRPPATEVARL